MDTPYAYTVIFDMIRVRIDGAVVPRHNVGLQRAVRGTLLVGDKRLEGLQRHARVATFQTEDQQTLELIDASLLHITAETMVLTGFERNTSSGKEIDYAQTWVLRETEGAEPLGSHGPPYPR